MNHYVKYEIYTFIKYAKLCNGVQIKRIMVAKNGNQQLEDIDMNFRSEKVKWQETEKM